MVRLPPRSTRTDTLLPLHDALPICAVYGQIDIPEGATDTSVAIKDSTGKTLRTISVGALEAGKHDFAWDGKNDAGEAVTPGPVTIEATANVGGKREALNTSVYALVQAVSLPTANSPMTVELLGVGPVDRTSTRLNSSH